MADTSYWPQRDRVFRGNGGSSVAFRWEARTAFAEEDEDGNEEKDEEA